MYKQFGYQHIIIMQSENYIKILICISGEIILNELHSMKAEMSRIIE